MITVKQALESINDLDDYCRMESGIDPIGPRECLISFVRQYEQLRAENAAYALERDIRRMAESRNAELIVENERLKAELARSTQGARRGDD